MKRGKIYRNLREKLPTEQVSVKEAIAALKENHRQSFDEIIEIHIHLGVDAGKSDQQVRGTVVLPGGTAKQKKVAVFVEEEAKQQEAKAAGASLVGGEDLIRQVEETGTLEVDITIATPEMMPKIAKVARILGPKGLMPNPKTGTVTTDPAGAVKDLAGGKLSFKMDQLGNIHESMGRISWGEDQLVTNIEALLEAVKGARPNGTKGELIRSVTVATTMGPGVSLSL